jgi:NAD(P)-dependent dehydrogenase (short-subunit alcohol dehydrogenase family)
MSALSGRRIVVTGISRGIGLETARLFLREGAEVLGVAKNPERLEGASRELEAKQGRLTLLQADLTEVDAPARIAAAVAERWGALDVLFNNAAVQIDGNTQGILGATEATFDSALAINLVGPYRLCRALLPALLSGREPRIVNVSSGAGNFESMRSLGIPSYRLSKWSLNGLTLLMAAELAGKVAVNAFDPGWVKTDLGGPNAPGSPSESARGALALVTLPFQTTGKFWKDGSEIPF